MRADSVSLRDINAARLLLEYYGYDSLSYFSLHEKKRFFFSSTARSFLSYTILRKVALVSGDPIGPRDDISRLLQEFTYFAKGAALTVCFVGIQEATVPLVHALNHKVFHIGEEAIIDLLTYEKQNLTKKVRRAEKHIVSLSITAAFFKRRDLPRSYLQQIEEISEQWLRGNGGKERGLSMTLGRLPNELDTDCEFVLALDGDRVLGYLTFVPAYASHMLSLDESRRRLETPNGLTEFMLLQAFDYYGIRGVRKMSLNFATFHRQDVSHTLKPQKQLKSFIYTVLGNLYKTDQLYSFNDKFLPQWQSRYIAFEKKRRIPSYLLAIARTELNI